MSFRIILLSCLIISVFSNFYFLNKNSEKKIHQDIPFFTNEEFINGLRNTKLDLDNHLDVLKFVMSRINKDANIYPSENYYYFKFPANGRFISGVLLFSANEISKKTVHFSYGEYSQNFLPLKDKKMFSKSFELTQKDGVFLNKVDNLSYSLEFRGQKIIFHLNSSPTKISFPLDMHEELIGKTLDDSGLSFFLLFNKKTNSFYWILNELDFVTEHFEEIFPKVYIGIRTKFLFFQDLFNERKILMAVNENEAMSNTMYDGPFDQLMDNDILSGNILNFKDKLVKAGLVEKKSKLTNGEIDKFGFYMGTPKGISIRVCIAPYALYRADYYVDDLSFIKECKKIQDTDEFRLCLTKERSTHKP